MNRIIHISIDLGNAQWYEGLLTNGYVRLLTTYIKEWDGYEAELRAYHEKVQKQKRGENDELSAIQDPPREPNPIPQTEHLVILLESLEELLSANPRIPKILHGLCDAIWWREQSVLEMTRVLSVLTMRMEMTTTYGQRGQNLTRAGGFGILCLYYVLKALTELPSSTEDGRREILTKCIQNFVQKPKKARQAFAPVLDLLPPVPPPKLAVTDETLPSEYEEWAVKLCWFFRACPLIPYQEIGEFFGCKEADSVHAIAVFCAGFDYTDLRIDEAQRMLLEAFIVPKEAQQIDRIMKVFAHTYYARMCDAHGDGNGGGDVNLYKAPDSCYTLAFSIILLNSDQHNPQVKKPMTLEAFIRNNRGTNEGTDFDEELQTKVFNNIHQNELRTPQSGGYASEMMLGKWHTFNLDKSLGPQITLHASNLLDTPPAMKRSTFLKYCGSAVFNCLVHMVRVDRFATSPVFSCIENLWRMEDVGGDERSSSCVALLSAEAFSLFRLAASLPQEASEQEKFAEAVLAQNKRPIKCIKCLFDFLSIGPNRMVQDGSFIVLCIFFALYSCWEEPQIPFYDPELIVLPPDLHCFRLYFHHFYLLYYHLLKQLQ